MSVPEVLVRARTLREDDRELSPDAVAAVRKRCTGGSTGTDVLELVVPDVARTAEYLTVPVVRQPSVVAIRIGPALGVAAVPFRVPLHVEMVAGIGRITPV